MKELFVPIALLAILASMLIPIPDYALDFLIVGNLGLSLLLLISSFYISDTLKLSALPTLLLVATLYRLSLNVASTRLILGHGEAGDIIEAFGSIVISGNIIVGTIIFLVITLIQFLVIAKGSERVAEVAARFTLDALPGKQMSIDADLNAGIIDQDTNKLSYVASGTIVVPPEQELYLRLKEISSHLYEVIDTYQPDVAVIEKVFLNTNPQSTLLLGHARGAAMLSLAQKDLAVSEYTALQIK